MTESKKRATRITTSVAETDPEARKREMKISGVGITDPKKIHPLEVVDTPEDSSLVEEVVDLVFGIPPKRTPIIVKYPDKAVLTIDKYPDKVSKGYRFFFNDKAIELLEFKKDGNDLVGISLNTGKIIIANVTNFSNKESIKTYRLAKQGSVSNKEIYKYLREFLYKELIEKLPPGQEAPESSKEAEDYEVGATEHKYGFPTVELKNKL